MYCESVMSVQHVQKWMKEFCNGRTNIFDEEQAGRPNDVSTLQFCQWVEAKIMENHNIQLLLIADKSNTTFALCNTSLLAPRFCAIKSRSLHIVLSWRHLVMYSQWNQFV